MKMINIFEDGSLVIAPNDDWNLLLNRVRKEARQQGILGLGHYVASAALQRAGNEDLFHTMQLFIDAAQPPLDEAELSSFRGAFMTQAALEKPSDLARIDAMSAEREGVHA